MSAEPTLMDSAHPSWQEFCARLRALEPARCDHTMRVTRRVLETLEGVEVEGSLEAFEAQGGYCDCEVVLNVIIPAEEKSATGA